MIKVKKLKDKSLNLDVQGQGCWSDCMIPGTYYFSRSVPQCTFIEAHMGIKTSVWH